MPTNPVATEDPFQLTVATDGFRLIADVSAPVLPRGVVIMANGSNPELHTVFQAIAEGIYKAGFATLMVDLLTENEMKLVEKGHAPRSSVPLLRRRLGIVLREARRTSVLHGLPVAVFGSSVAASAAISLATHEASPPNALVLYDGRLDLGRHDLPWLQVPALLLVCEENEVLVEANEAAAERLTHAPSKLVSLPPTKDRNVLAADETVKWLQRYLLVPSK